MVIWSILTQKAWNDLRRHGRLKVTHRHAMQEFLAPYTWMACQMERRLKISRPNKKVVPIWVWCQWEGASRRKPDLRAAGYLPRGEQGVRIELDVDDDRVLLSDFDLWHYVLNYWYLPESEKDGREFERKLARAGLSFYGCSHECPLMNIQYRRQIEQSWERIFDINWSDRRHAIASPLKKKSIQATLWEICMKDVSEVREFTAR